jgi:hypothetical protein
MKQLLRLLSCAAILLCTQTMVLFARTQQSNSSTPSAQGVPLSELLSVIRQKAKSLENASGMRLGFQAFMGARHLSPDSIRYSDYVVIRLLFEATRDAGLWSLHWNITDQPPNSDNIWRQWRMVSKPSVWEPSATAECDELSALVAFLVERAGVKTVGLFWPAPNHTVAVWVVRPVAGPVIRVVIPTSQIFLTETDFFDTRKFDPWRQKTIYEYTRRDVPDSFELSKPLADFFIGQLDKYAGASDATLQHLRYLRDAVFNRQLTPEQAGREALNLRDSLSPRVAEDVTALQAFTKDMRGEVLRK